MATFPPVVVGIDFGDTEDLWWSERPWRHAWTPDGCLAALRPLAARAPGVAGSALHVHFSLPSQPPWQAAILPGLRTGGETEAERGGVACAGSGGRSDTRPVQTHSLSSGWPRHSLGGAGQGGLPRRSAAGVGLPPRPWGAGWERSRVLASACSSAGPMWEQCGLLSPAAWLPGRPEQPGRAGRPNMAPGPCCPATGRAGAWPGLGRAGLPASSSAGR